MEATERRRDGGASVKVKACPVGGCQEAVAENRMCLRHWHRVSVRTRELIHRARVNYWRQCSRENKNRLEQLHGKALVEAMSEMAARSNVVP